jgi:hypothetical protein
LSVTGTIGFDGLTGSTGAGSLCLDSNKQVVYNSASDNCLSSTRATKHDIQTLSLDDLDVVSRLEPVSFVYNQGDGRVRYGFIAEDTASVDAHLATYDASGAVSGIDDRSILAILVGAIKRLWEKVLALIESDEAQNARIKQLEDEVAALKAAAGTPAVSGTGAPAASVARPAASSTADSDNTADDNEPETAAGATRIGGAAAPGGSSGPVASPDTATSTTPIGDKEGTGAPASDGQLEAPASGPDPEEPGMGTDTTTATAPQSDDSSSADQPNSAPQPANDTSPTEQLPATGTE